MSIMLDTGSTVSIISEKMWRKSGTFGVDIWPVCGSLTTHKGSAITILGETDMCIRIGDSDINFPMIVANNISHNCLIGTDFFRKYCCNIKYDTEHLQFREVKFQFVMRSSPQLSVRSLFSLRQLFHRELR